MNYEEIIETKNSSPLLKQQLPYGYFYKKLVDKKYQNILEIRADLLDSIVFTEGLKAECAQVATLDDPRQIQFTPNADSAGIYSLTLEQGNYITFAQLLDENPAIVASPGFIESTVRNLAQLTSFLHSHDIRHVCYAPQNVFVRKSDNSVRLICHGSFYQGMSDPAMLYQGYEDYVAPEVMDGGEVDDRCDIYSLGRFIESLFVQSEMPLEYRLVVRRATHADPDKRYATPEDLLSDIGTKRNLRKTTVTAVAALVIALLVVVAYLELMPKPEPVEFVKTTANDIKYDVLDDGTFDPEDEIDFANDTLAGQLTPEQLRQQKEYEAKAEQIFRKQYAEKADEILSRIYNKDYMSSSEKNFMAASSSVMEELVSLQTSLGGQAGLSTEKTQRIASEIIEQLTEKKKKQLDYYGIQKEKKE